MTCTMEYDAIATWQSTLHGKQCGDCDFWRELRALLQNAVIFLVSASRWDPEARSSIGYRTRSRPCSGCSVGGGFQGAVTDYFPSLMAYQRKGEAVPMLFWGNQFCLFSIFINKNHFFLKDF